MLLNPELIDITMDKTNNNCTTGKILTLYAQIWLYQLIGLFIFGIGRFVYLFQHTTNSELMENIDHMPMFLYNSLRFDVQAVTYIATPMILAALAVSFIKGENAIRRMRKTMQWYFTVMLTIVTMLVIGEFYYYDNFESRYNIVFFDFFDEGPAGLLKTMWDDYPLLSILLCVIGIGIAIHLTGKYISRIKIKNRRWMGMVSATAATLLIPLFSFIFIRGSIGIYPLQVEAFEVSPNENINGAVPNAIYLLDKAHYERSNSFKLKSDKEVLSESGFATIEEAIKTSALNHNNNDYGDVEKALFNVMSRPECPDFEQPNILLIINESWSRFLMEMDKEGELDLLCSLRPHLLEDIVLRNYQSVRNGTIYSLENIILAMPYNHFFQSCYRYDSLETSIASTLKKSGYSTLFVAGMDPTWENLNEALKVQHFDRVDGRVQIMNAIENSTTSEIGVYDEFLYRYLEQELKKGNTGKEPRFIMAITTTNHPPFTYPNNMELPPLTEEWYKSPNITGSDDVKTKYGLGAQYANRCLGDFLTWFKSSSFADNTIVIATGDHNVRSILNYDIVPSEYKHAVPFYVYLPPKYRMSDTAKRMIEDRYGCHYDILPTIAAFALKDGVKYLSVGNNLLDTLATNEGYYSYNEKQTLAPACCNTDSIKRLVEARETLLRLYFQRIFNKNNQ